MAFGNFFTGSPATSQQFPVLSPQQLSVKGAASNQALNMLQNLGGTTGFEPIAQQARTQFKTQTVPSLAERFTAFGGGAQRSSAFPALLGQQAAGLEEGLAGLQSQHGIELLKLLLGASLAPETESRINQPQPGFLQNTANTLLQLLPMLAGAYFGGPGGTAAGQAAGTGLKELFNNFFGSNRASGVNLPNYSNLMQNVMRSSPVQTLTGPTSPTAGVNLPNYNALINSIIGVK